MSKEEINIFSFDETMGVVKANNELEEIHEFPNGLRLYRRSNGLGGHQYWSDEIGGGTLVWDTCLVDERTMMQAIIEEDKRKKLEKGD